MPWCVSRQRYYDRNLQLAVEIAEGLKNAGKDILPFKYKGEGKNFLDPRDAVKNAIEIYKTWTTFNNPGENIELNIVHDSGGRYFFDKKGISALEKWGNLVYASMDKCGNCASLIPKKYIYVYAGIGGTYCNEACCSAKYRQVFGVEMPQNIKK